MGGRKKDRHTSADAARIDRDLLRLRNLYQDIYLAHVEGMGEETMLQAALCNLGVVFDTITSEMAERERKNVSTRVLEHVLDVTVGKRKEGEAHATD